MARFNGPVGYGTSVEDPPNSGVWKDQITEIVYTGDVIRETRRLDTSDVVVGNVNVANRISIVADQHAIDHFTKIKYVYWAGVYWVVTSVEVQHPRLILSLGGVYNGPKA